jgi:hypothetical protein
LFLKALSRKNAMALLPPLAAAKLRHFAQHIERPSEDVALDVDGVDSIKPYWDPILARSRRKRWELFAELHRAGIVGFSSSIKAAVGIFFVKKKRPGEIRMVIDARRANRSHRRPPRSRLASAACYSEVAVDGSLFENEGAGEVCGFKTYSCHGNEADVSDGFWNFEVDELSDWFGIDEPITIEELAAFGVVLVDIWDPEMFCRRRPEKGEIL